MTRRRRARRLVMTGPTSRLPVHWREMHRDAVPAAPPFVPDSELVTRLRRAILVRDGLRPGSPKHWRAACEVRTLQRLLVQEGRGTEDASRR